MKPCPRARVRGGEIGSWSLLGLHVFALWFSTVGMCVCGLWCAVVWGEGPGFEPRRALLQLGSLDAQSSGS